MHGGSCEECHQLERLKVDADDAVLTVVCGRQLTGQR